MIGVRVVSCRVGLGPLAVPGGGKLRKYVYYFCHIHPGMSAKIVLENLPNPDGAIVPYCADGSIPGCPEPTAPDPSDFDEKCGTWNTGEHDNMT